MAKEFIKFYEGTKARASEVNYNFEQMEGLLNERIGELRTYLENEFKKVSGNFVLPGTIIHVAYGSVPSGYLKCDGTEYLIEDYPELYAAIGNIYGSTDSTKFKVPDFRGAFLRGYGGNSASIGQKQEAALPNITGRFSATVAFSGSNDGAFYRDGSYQAAGGGAANGKQYHFDASRSSSIYQNDIKEVRPENYAVILCIKY